MLTTTAPRRACLRAAMTALCLAICAGYAGYGESLDKTRLPQGMSFSLHHPRSGQTELKFSIAALRWQGVRKGFIRIGIGRVLALEDLVVVIRDAAGWKRLRETVVHFASSKGASGWEIAGLRLSEGFDASQEMELTAATGEPRSVDIWDLRRVVLRRGSDIWEQDRATIQWRSNGVFLVASSRGRERIQLDSSPIKDAK